MEKCKACGKPLGSNKDCEECLTYLIERGKEDVDEESADRAASDGEEWLRKRGKSAPQKLIALVKLFIEIVRDYRNGSYKKIPWDTVLFIVVAIIYVVNPFDLVPDFIPVVGWLDDVAVVSLVIAAIANDLREYCIWKGYNPDDYGL
ncbi:MAG: DUF1232 domain-containing protein [Deltaproteobacteria bacterium]|nr:DUF1232 domain-containing protein [Deltaproteobacteria bacterium]MBW2305416.1 DUF1232 domain-containing protein [Deltaproteobacteria bacterium]